MTGRTNVGGGGSDFTATIQVSTDPNAVITAVNLAGDTFSGTANASGNLSLVVNKPGTYAISETGGGLASVVVSDYGGTYSVSVYIFDGYVIKNGLYTVYQMEALGVWSGGSGVVANATATEGVSHSDPDETYTCVELETVSANTSQCCLVTVDEIVLSNYSTLSMVAASSHFDTFGVGVFSKVTDPYRIATLISGGPFPSYYGSFQSAILDISGISGSYCVGVYIERPSSPQTIDFYIKELKLE